MLSEEIEPLSSRSVALRVVAEASFTTSARTPTPLGTPDKVRRYLEFMM